MQDVGKNELIGLFESIRKNEDTIHAHAETVKELRAEIKKLTKEFAKEKEISEKNISNAYKYYKECVIDGENSSEDYFTLCAMVDTFDSSEGE